MLLLSSICNGQGRSNFGATRAQDTSFTPAQLKFGAYAGSADTTIPVIMPNGDVKKVAKNHFSGRLGFTPETLLNILDFGAIPDDGEDDTQPIQDAIDSAHALGGRVRVYCPSGVYHIDGALQKTKNGRACNAQLVIPHNDRVQDGSDGFIYITIDGESVPWEIDSYLSSLGAATESKVVKNTTTFRSTINNDGSLYPSVISVASDSNVTNHLGINIRNLTVQVRYDSSLGGTQLCGIDYNEAMSQMTQRVRVCLDTSSVVSSVKTHEVFGIRGGNEWGMTNTLDEVTVAGFKYGVAIGEHGIANKVAIYNCDYAVNVQYNTQGLRVADVVPHGCKWSFSAGLVAPIGVGRLNGYYHAEKTNTGVGATEGDLYDPSSLLTGQLYYINWRTVGGFDRTFVKNGGQNMVVSTTENGRIYSYGNNATGGRYDDSLDYVITNGGIVASKSSSNSMSTPIRPFSFTLGAGYTGSGRTDGFIAANNALGTGQNLSGGLYNVGVAGSTINTTGTTGYNIGVRGGAAFSSTWNIGVIGSCALTTTGGNVGAFFNALQGAARNVGLMAYMGAPSTMPTISGNSAIVADNGTLTTSSVFIGQVAGVPKFRIDSAGNIMIIGTGLSNIVTPSGNPLDLYSNTNTTVSLKMQNFNSGSSARTALDLSNDAGHNGRISKVSTTFSGGVIAVNDFVIGNTGAGNIVITNSVASGTIDFSTNTTLRMRIKSNGAVNIASVSTYADNAAALAGGLVAGDVYRTSTGQLMIVF